MKKLTKITSAILSAAMLCAVCTSTAFADEKSTEVKSKISSTSDYLRTQDSVLDGTLGNEWVLFGLARNNTLPDGIADKYFENLEAKVESNGSAKLDKNKSTENSRVILTLSAMGKDARNVAGYNLLEPYADQSYVVKQGLNGAVYALIAIDTYGYEIPADESVATQTTRESLVEYILSKAVENGGWAFWGTTADTDMTFMAITALAPYYDTNDEVKSAVDKALDNLSSMQNDDGTYTAWGSTSSESLAQVVVGLSALGLDSDTDSRFVKNASVLDALMTFGCDNGFKHVLSGDYNGMATEQGFYALVAYDRFSESENSLYDMADAEPYSVKFDVNDDGRFSVSDASLIQKYLAEYDINESFVAKRADANGDGKISVSDVSLMQKLLSEQI